VRGKRAHAYFFCRHCGLGWRARRPSGSKSAAKDLDVQDNWDEAGNHVVVEPTPVPVNPPAAMAWQMRFAGPMNGYDTLPYWMGPAHTALNCMP